MAVVLTLSVLPATQEQFNVLDDRVGQAMMSAGGPPAGLMSHVVYPGGDGFVVAEVWRTESEGRDYIDEVLRPLVTEVGLTPLETECLPVWSFARP
jgi:hypothetical protein